MATRVDNFGQDLTLDSGLGSWRRRLQAYYHLTKPSIVFLVAVTALTTLIAEGHIFEAPWTSVFVLLGIVLSAGSANALNQFIDRDIDSVMDRTRGKRPLPRQYVGPKEALVFGLLAGIVSNLFLAWLTNWLAAAISVATILFYIFVYTLWLKRRHHYNIVIGGAAGATAPMIASAAMTGHVSPLAWILFAVIFFWTPPHFWALALAIKDQYAKVKIPMLPNVLGDLRTQKEIYWYTISLLPISILPLFWGVSGWIYAVVSVALWIWYMKETVVGLRTQTVKSYKKLFFVSIGYLFLLFLGVALDGAVRYWINGSIS